MEVRVFVCAAFILLVQLKRHADAFIKPNARIIKAGNILCVFIYLRIYLCICICVWAVGHV